ncbi:helix-turn-helix transcriptional regulator [Paenibacillus sp. 19GGS1-52]|uniref:PadR family transcriptional regulator n=1 Tax=Paenibacillus sp. 19GGS1-52 TaxID=2758563 RepID=UPI001EFAB7D0|nr:PadR family transcriptional regulator [Paenibacillus sp. 19GGS1-52]ULO06651.1 helix-turn-helix transcriptional regulator [Paenibacillus sp. 19GGS1-52]
MNRNSLLPLTETTYYIMLVLQEPAHGYLIMQKVEEMSLGDVRIAAGTLYGAVENLLKLQLIERIADGDNRRKVYVLTAKGRELLGQDAKRMNHMTSLLKEMDYDVEI